jgi:hypothetical protein
MICGLTWIFQKLLELNRTIVEAITSTGVDADVMITTFDVVYPQGIAIIYIVLLLIMAIMFLILAIQYAIRFAEISFLYIMGPIAIATNVNNEYNLFPVWWRNVLSTVFTQAIQTLLIAVFLNVAAKISGGLSMENFILAIGYLVLILKSPQFIKEFMYSTGSGKAVGGAVSSAVTSVAKQLISRAK